MREPKKGDDDMTTAPVPESELLPCPFCGGEPERLELTDEENFGGSVISCKRCGASSPVHFDRKENLLDSWNRRSAAIAPTVKALEWRSEPPYYKFLYDANPHDERVTLLAVSVARQQSAGFKNVIDLQQWECPDCGGPGFNSGWGVIDFVCGGELVGEDFSGCTRAKAQEPRR